MDEHVAGLQIALEKELVNFFAELEREEDSRRVDDVKIETWGFYNLLCDDAGFKEGFAGTGGETDDAFILAFGGGFGF